MRRAQDDGVRPGVEHGPDVAFDHPPQLWSVQVGFLDVLDQSRHRLDDHLHVAAKPVEQRGEPVRFAHGCWNDRADNAGPGRHHRRFDTRLDADHGDRQRAPESFGRPSGTGVGTYDDRLDPLGDKEPGDREATIADEPRGLVAPGRIRGISHVIDRLRGQGRANLAQHRQAPDAGVEDPDGGLIHDAKRLARTPNSPPWRRTCASSWI